MNSARSNRIVLSRSIVGVSGVLYALSLTQATFCVPSGCRGWPGWGVLLWGWLEPLVGLADVGPLVGFSWYANLCVFPAWLLAFTSNRRLSLAFAGAGLLLGSAFLLGKVVLVSEGGVPYKVIGYAAGYWLWLASLAAAVAAALVCPPDKVGVSNGVA